MVGMFRVSGSSKRVQQLQKIFDTPPSYGLNIDWSEYSIHDAASAMRRYLNALPEPVIPMQYYDVFRKVLGNPSLTAFLPLRSLHDTVGSNDEIC